MAKVVIISTLGVLAACQRPLSEAPFQRAIAVPLTVEQALPSDVSALAVFERDGCYYYRRNNTYTLIDTTAAPDAQQRCAA